LSGDWASVAIYDGRTRYVALLHLRHASLVKAFTGQTLEGVATVDEQLRLLADEVMPSFR
jgi:hypothetical protein